ncbi:MAG: hypothetical protein BMS9Abin11_1068 [Gammaproteobacteria bacterium]|nr:MAG: hypothetical protein BMS9Abin11_1068 [Gammaproteobacteria bacterium]
MKYINDDVGKHDADSAEDAVDSTAYIEQQLAEIEQQMTQLPAGFDAGEKAALQLDAAAALVGLSRGEEAWDHARQALDAFLETGAWEQAAHACDVMFNADQPDSLAALGQGIWLAVTYPVDPELSVALLQHIVDETPDDADGAAVAAAVACYIVDMRAEGKQSDDLVFFTSTLLSTVARRHQDIESQEQFDFWFKKLELDDPAKFLPRLRNVVDVLVQDNWWFDREALQTKLPVH